MAAALISDPQENILAWPGDVITLIQAPEKFSVFAATSTNLQVPFGAERRDLAQAIAKAGGLLDLRADPEGVFLFRFESPAAVRALAVPDLGRNPAKVRLSCAISICVRLRATSWQSASPSRTMISSMSPTRR